MVRGVKVSKAAEGMFLALQLGRDPIPWRRAGVEPASLWLQFREHPQFWQSGNQGPDPTKTSSFLSALSTQKEVLSGWGVVVCHVCVLRGDCSAGASRGSCLYAPDAPTCCIVFSLVNSSKPLCS